MAVGTQNHIHLRRTSDRPWGSEGAPSYKYSVIAQGGYTRRPRPFIALDRALDGTPHVHRLVNTDDTPVVINDMGHTLLVTSEELTTLMESLGYVVDYVDNVHPDDGEDHSDYVHLKLFTAIKSLTPFDPMLGWYAVQLQLDDLESAAG